MPNLTRANAVHVRIQDRPCGPLTQDQVKALVRQGTVSAGDSISMDGGQHWTHIGQTSLVKYLPVRRVHGRLQPPTMPDHIDLSFTAEMMALPAPPPEAAPVRAQAAPAPARRSPGVLWVVGAGGLAAGLLLGILVGRASVRQAGAAKPAGPPPPPVLALSDVDRSRSGQVISFAGTLGQVEERADPAQLPGLANRCVLVRVQARGVSVQVAVPWRETEEPKPNTVYVPMSDSGVILAAVAAKLSDTAGASVPKGARVKITGKVRFKVSDVPMVYPVIEAMDLKSDETE